MRLIFAWTIAAFTTAIAAGCGGNVVVDKPSGGAGGTGGNSAGGNGSAGNNVGGGGTGGTTVPPSTSSGLPGSPGHALIVNDGTITVLFSSQDVTCKNPSPQNNGCGWWNITVAMPESLLVPGTIDLSTAPVKAFFQEAGDSISGQSSCPGSSGGGMLPTKLIVHSVDVTAAQIEVVGFTALMINGKPDGLYSATRCKNAN